MILRRGLTAIYFCAVLAALSGFVGSSGLASAQERVGSATLVRNEVDRLGGGATSRVSVGDSLFRREVVQTGADSLAKVVLLDSTNLSLGPRARLALDDYVVTGGSSASKVALRLVSGAFRFVTGGSDKRAYEIVTPTATIGIRGTVFQVQSSPARTTVTLEDGVVTACSRGQSRRCITLDKAGDVAIITLNGVSRGAIPSGGTAFAALCAAEPGLCTASGPGGTTATAALCGR